MSEGPANDNREEEALRVASWRDALTAPLTPGAPHEFVTDDGFHIIFGKEAIRFR